MSLEYVEARIKEALSLAHGNRSKARQQIIAWAHEDSKLLLGLTKPHLNGVVAYNIERVDSGRAEAAKAFPPPVQSEPLAPPMRAPVQQSQQAQQKAAPPTSSLPSQAAKPAKKKEEQFGLEILKAIAGERQTIFGLEDPGAPRSRQGVSQKHIDAINAITGRNKRPPQ